MRVLTSDDARRGVLGGGVFACGGGGWQHHGELMGGLATSVGRPVLASVDELPADSWVATVTAIGAPASKNWEIQPVDYVHALQKLIEVCEHPISAVMTAQNGYSTTHNGWIQSAVLGVKVLDAAGDVRAHPTGKLGSLGLTTRPGYVSTQVVSGGNRELHGHFLSVNQGSVATCDDVLRDISVRTGGFIASARNPVELSWVREHAALGSISLALDLGAAMEACQGKGDAVVEAVCATIGARELARGPLGHESELVTTGGWDHGTFRIGEFTVPYLNEYMAVDSGGERVASYPDTIAILRADDGFPLAVKDAVAGMEVVLLIADAATLPLSTSALDPVAVGECEQLMGIDFLRYLPSAA
ncbi:DUF917 family protein [Amycolatopsis suaedae]|uniref:DUF917 family protein n=1 Tax=Amycolatopsis suaedae TaxID=2510978 RepID=A0A4Q7J2W5_9PSEU|nr:DUF917 family protein [Amycolatopsis suaedae]RZQ60942.1 DUF917 family protein [Amycolatopsis suaedae]